MLILDTDVLSIVQRGTGPEFESLADYLRSADDDVCVTIISFEEQMRGWLAAVAGVKAVERQILPYRKLHELLEDFQSRPIIDFDDLAANLFGRLRRAKLRVGTMDPKIASIALVNDAILVTKNVRDFMAIPGIRLSEWRA